MNRMNNNITIQKLSVNPLLAYSISIPEPEELQLTNYERCAYPAIIGNLTNMSILEIKPKFKMGRVLSFDVSPRTSPDPILIYSPIGNLREYYSVWADVMKNGMGIFGRKKLAKYDLAIESFVKSGIQLTTSELVFSVIEMLKFKNDIMLNWR